MSTEAKIASQRAAWLVFQGQEFDRWLGWCESPIEQLALATLIQYGGWNFHAEGYLPPDHGMNLLEGTGVSPTWRRVFCGSSMIVLQAEVELGRSRYRLDMALLTGGDKFAIEFDGHDFHERTKEQARRDKARDRAFTLAGWKVLRFTGSEVYANPEGVVDQIGDAMVAAVERAMEAMGVK